MDVRELYESINVDFDDVVSRMMGREDLVIKYLKKFIDDPNFVELKKAVVKNNYDQALIAAHTLKGVAANLGLLQLSEACGEIVTALRNDQKELLFEQFTQVDLEYHRVLKKIQDI